MRIIWYKTKNKIEVKPMFYLENIPSTLSSSKLDYSSLSVIRTKTIVEGDFWSLED